MARKARWLGLLATYRELSAREREAVDRVLKTDPQARELKRRFDEQDALLASLDPPRPSPAVTDRVMAATVARGGAPQTKWRPVLAAALALVLLVTVGGTGVAAGGSLPGDVLYPIKRAGEEVRMALTLREQERAQYAERLGEVRRQEVNALLELGRAGIAVQFEGPLEHSPTGEWLVAGVPILLPEDAGETPRIAAGSPVYVIGEIGQDRVRVQTMQLMPSSIVPASSAEPHPGREDVEPAVPGRTPGPPSREPTAESSQGTDRPRGGDTAATHTPKPTSTPTLTPTEAQDKDRDKSKDQPPGQSPPAKSTPPGQDKGPQTPAAPEPKKGEDATEADTTTEGQGPPPSTEPTATPPGGANKSPDGHPQPTRRSPHAGPQDQREAEAELPADSAAADRNAGLSDEPAAELPSPTPSSKRKDVTPRRRR